MLSIYLGILLLVHLQYMQFNVQYNQSVTRKQSKGYQGNQSNQRAVMKQKAGSYLLHSYVQNKWFDVEYIKDYTLIKIARTTVLTDLHSNTENCLATQPK